MNIATTNTVMSCIRPRADLIENMESLTGDEYRIFCMPGLYLLAFAVISVLKHGLMTAPMSAVMRLKILDRIARCVDGPVTAEAVAAIQPACDTARKIFSELHSLPLPQRSRAFDDGDVFRLMAQLNPSLLTALRLCVWRDDVPEDESVSRRAYPNHKQEILEWPTIS